MIIELDEELAYDLAIRLDKGETTLEQLEKDYDGNGFTFTLVLDTGSRFAAREIRGYHPKDWSRVRKLTKKFQEERKAKGAVTS